MKKWNPINQGCTMGAYAGPKTIGFHFSNKTDQKLIRKYNHDLENRHVCHFLYAFMIYRFN